MLIKLIGKVWKRLPRKFRTQVTRVAQPRFTVSAAGIITNDEGRVLLLDHVLRPTSGWGVPGGFMNYGEQPEAAFRREIREETGIELADVKVHRCRTFQRHIEIIFTAKGIGEPRVLSREITALGWFEVEEMPEEMSVDQHFLIRRALRPED
ncbi:NUDIX domain-containing protein [soil metagenome]